MSPDTASWLQAGGVLAFAGLVLELLRRLLPVLKGFSSAIHEVREELFEIRITFAATLERDRIREARRKREASDPPPIQSGRVRVVTPQAHPIVDFETEETTDIHDLIEQQREQASKTQRGLRAPRPGTHHDRNDKER